MWYVAFPRQTYKRNAAYKLNINFDCYWPLVVSSMTKSNTKPSGLLYQLRRALRALWSLVLLLLIGGALLALLYFVGGRDFYLWVSAKQWIETECNIQNASVGSQIHTSDGGGKEQRYRVVTNYWFYDEAEVVYGNRYNFMGEGYSTGFGKKSRAVRYLNNNPKVPCYYNPHNPDQSVIDRSFNPYMLFMIIPLVFLLMFVLAVFGSLMPSSKKRKRSKAKGNRGHRLP